MPKKDKFVTTKSKWEKKIDKKEEEAIRKVRKIKIKGWRW